MKNVYEVEYEVRYQVYGWNPMKKRVLANGNAQHAIDIAKSRALRSSYDEWNQRKQAWCSYRATGFRLVGVEHISQVDIG